MRIKIDSLVLVVVLPVVMASTCQTRSAMKQVRNVHMSVRAAFIAADEFVAPRFEVAADLCLRRSETPHHADQCMEKWLTLDTILATSREALSSLEVVYENIEQSSDGRSDWQYWILQILRHGQSLVRVLDEMNIEGADRIIDQIKDTLDAICEIANCEGGE